MPPKKATSTASKSKQVNGVKPATKAKSSTTTTSKKSKTTATKADLDKAAPKATTTKTATKPSTTSSKKRKAEETEEDEPQVNGTVAKRAKKGTASPASKTTTKKAAGKSKRAESAVIEKVAPAAKKAKAEPKAKVTKAKVKINTRPTQILDIYLFGGGEAGELGFAGAKGTKEIKRPRFNPYLEASKAGVVQFAVGGMHTAALTHDNKILTWGVNDQGALGRDTTWEGGLTDMKESGDDSDSDSDSDDGDINPHESTPKEVDFSGVDHVPEFTQVVASDSATFALTEEGLVYGWGTFRSNEGIFGFSEDTKIQERPALVKNLKNITRLAAGSNHVLALDQAGTIYAWGSGQQNQLGRRLLERYLVTGLTPGKFLKGKFADIFAGSYHSFATKFNGDVYSWGLNSFGQTGCEVDSDEGSSGVHLPTKVTSLSPNAINGRVVHITGGSQHSIAITNTGAALAWGRLDSFQVGLAIDKLDNDHVVRDANDRPRILTQPTQLPDIDAVTAEAGSDHSIVISSDGKAYSFGFNEYGQCGVGTTDDVKVAELIDNTAVRGKKLVAVGCGGQFSCLGSIHEEAKTNGA